MFNFCSRSSCCQKMGNPRLYTGPSSWRLSLLVMLAAYFACHVQIGVANGQTLETKVRV